MAAAAHSPSVWATTSGNSHFTSQVPILSPWFTPIFDIFTLTVPKSAQRSGDGKGITPFIELEKWISLEKLKRNQSQNHRNRSNGSLTGRSFRLVRETEV
jgi:hypothetical protein